MSFTPRQIRKFWDCNVPIFMWYIEGEKVCPGVFCNESLRHCRTFCTRLYAWILYRYIMCMIKGNINSENSLIFYFLFSEAHLNGVCYFELLQDGHFTSLTISLDIFLNSSLHFWRNFPSLLVCLHWLVGENNCNAFPIYVCYRAHTRIKNCSLWF